MLEDVLGVIERAIRKADELRVAVSVAVVDEAGHLVALERMDGADFVTPEIAWGKAWTAAAFHRSTAELVGPMSSAAEFSFAITSTFHGRFTPRQGGLPLPGGGGIGASGASHEEDDEIAAAGIKGLGGEV
jgi:uncharacterized protein GlcG (DUF336 family)